MRGKGLYFYALKEDFLENLKELEREKGGLIYIKDLLYKEPKFEIYSSVEELTDIGEIRFGIHNEKFYDQWQYYVLRKNEEFEYRKTNLEDGGYNYSLKNTLGTIVFKPSGIYYGTNCVIKGEITTISVSESSQTLFKEFKKALLKNLRLPEIGRLYVGKSLVENKGKYRLVYGSPNSPIDSDYNIQDMIWVKKGKR